MVPGYLKHSSGQARVIVNGKVFYLGRHGSKASRQKYDAVIAEFLASGRSKSFGITAVEVTVGNLIVDYLAHCKRYYSGGTEHVATKVVMRAVALLYADLSAVEFGPLQYKAVRQKLIDDPTCLRTKKCNLKPTKRLSRNYINSQMKRVSRMFRWASAEGTIPGEVYNAIRLVPSLQRGRTTAEESAKVRPVSLDLVKLTLPHCTQVVADMIRFHLLTGCRPQDVCNITPKMIDRSGEVWTANMPEHKTAYRGNERILYLGPTAQKVIASYLDRDADANCFSPVEADRQRRDKLTANRKTPPTHGNSTGTNIKKSPKRKPGGKYNSQSYCRAVRYACERGGLEAWAPNQLRHTAGTMVRAEFGLEHSQAILGHTKADVTQVYAEADRQRALEAALADSSRSLEV